MSVSKKRAAPKPPMNPDLPIERNKENVIKTEKENGKEPGKPKLSGGKLFLKVVLPDQTTEDITVSSDASLMDLRTKLCAKYKLSMGEHKLEALDEDGRTIQVTSSTVVSSIPAKAVHLKPKAKEPVKIAPPKVVEQTIRLTLKMSASNLQVVRVRPSVPLNQLLPQILEKSGVKQEDYKYLELRHPQQTTMALDTTRTLDEYKIKEIFVADRRVRVESPEPELRASSPATTPEKNSGKIARGGTEKRSKKIKKFFGLSKKRKSSSASSNEALSPSSPVLSPPIEELKKAHANSNENNSNEREKTPKKKRQAPVKHIDQQPQNEPLHGQVTEKMDESHAEKTEKEEPLESVETKVQEEENEVQKIPTSPPKKPTAPPRQKPPVAAARTGKKKAPPPPVCSTVPTPQAEPESLDEHRSRPDKPPRRHSIERQKSPDDDEADGKPESEAQHNRIDGGAIEIEVQLGKSMPQPSEFEDKASERSESLMEEVDGKDGYSIPDEDNPSEILDQDNPSEIPDDDQSLPSPLPEESQEEMQVEEAAFSSGHQHELYLSQPVVISSPIFETPLKEDEAAVQDKDLSPEMNELHELDQKLDKYLEQEPVPSLTEDVSVPVEPLDTSDITPPPEEEDSDDQSESDEILPSPPDPVGDFEVLPAPGEMVPPPEAEETKYVEEIPQAYSSADQQNPKPLSDLEPPPPPAEVTEMVSRHDIGYKVDVVLTENDLLDAPEPEFLQEPEPVVAPPEPPVLDDEDNLFTTPADYNVYETKKKDDMATMEAKALEMLKQFTLEGGDLPPPPDTILDNLTLPPLDESEKQKVPEESEEKSDKETMQEIERLKEQINLMRQKKAKKEAEEEEARRNPYTIVPETKNGADATKVQGKGIKTFTFVPNPRAKKQYEDYEAAPEKVINFSHGGEIKGLGISVAERPPEVRVETPEKPSSPVQQVPTSPTLQQLTQTPEVIVIEDNADPPNVEVIKSPISPVKPPVTKNPEPASQPATSAVKPKVTAGGYVSSAIMRQPVSSVPEEKPAQTYTPALYGSGGEPSKRSSLPNYYRRFLKMEVAATLEEEEKTPPKPTVASPSKTTPVDRAKLEAALVKKLPPKSLPLEKSRSNPPPQKTVSNGSATAVKTPPPVARKPKLAQTVNELLNSPRIENLPTPPEESHTTKPVVHALDDMPLPPPPEEFLTPTSGKDVSNLSHPLPPGNEYQSPSETSTPKRATTPGSSANFVGISAAKPFGSAGETKFRRMSAAFKDDHNSKHPNDEIKRYH